MVKRYACQISCNKIKLVSVIIVKQTLKNGQGDISFHFFYVSSFTIRY